MRPLEDVRIVSLEQFGAGPYGSVHLADLGAEVIKVEDPVSGGDVGRSVPPYAQDGDSLFFETFNRNKRSIALDIRNPVGRRVFEELLRESDALFSNLRGDVVPKLGLTYDDLKHINPRLVCCSLSGFGMSGPRTADPGYDYMLQALGGWMSLTGEPDGPPTKSGLSLVDFSGGIVAALALVAGVHAARRDGRGLDCDVSLFDTALSMLSYVGTWHLTGGYVPVRAGESAHPSLVPFQVFPTADAWIVIACAKEKFWQRLVEAMGCAHLADDPRFRTFADRYANREPVLDELKQVLRTRTTQQWLAVLGAAGVPCAQVNDVAQAVTDEHTVARGMVVETEHPRWGVVKAPGSPVNVGPRRTEHRRAPFLGEDADDLLRSLLGYDDDALVQMRQDGAFGEAQAGGRR
jgi:crotonobetainyl-CoA:carnitine CoA-transferase CaiB-like acyl-CoA transferase